METLAHIAGMVIAGAIAIGVAGGIGGAAGLLIAGPLWLGIIWLFGVMFDL